MKKAQWKKDPRERTFGKDPREVLNDELTAALKKANDIIQQQNRHIEHMKDQTRSMQDRLSRIYEFRAAYLALRSTGVVMEHGGMVVAVATEGDELVKGMADHVLWIPDAPWMLSPVATVLPLQMLAYHIATIRGLDVDQPRNLAKSVTVE